MGTTAKINGYVWCDVHGCIHEDRPDPYGAGQYECGPSSWRHVLVGECVTTMPPASGNERIRLIEAASHAREDHDKLMEYAEKFGWRVAHGHNLRPPLVAGDLFRLDQRAEVGMTGPHGRWVAMVDKVLLRGSGGGVRYFKTLLAAMRAADDMMGFADVMREIDERHKKPEVRT